MVFLFTFYICIIHSFHKYWFIQNVSISNDFTQRKFSRFSVCVCVLYENSRFKSTIDHWQCEWRKLSEKKTHRNGFERPPMEYFLLNAFLFRHRDHCEHTWLFCCLNHTRAVCSDLFSALFFSFDFSYKIHRFSSMVVIPFVSYRLVRFGFFSVCVCVCPSSFAYYYSMFPCLWLESLWEKKEKRIKSWSAKLKTISSILSVMLFSSRPMHPCGPGHRLSQTIYNNNWSKKRGTRFL